MGTALELTVTLLSYRRNEQPRRGASALLRVDSEFLSEMADP
jgi:hypothetical protein